MSRLDTEMRVYRSAVQLDSFLARADRRRFTQILWVIAGVFAMWIIVPAIWYGMRSHTMDIGEIVRNSQPFSGIFFMLFPLPVIASCMNFFYNTAYFRGLDVVLGESQDATQGMTLEAASVCFLGRGDLTLGLLESQYGKKLMLRLGIFPQDVSSFLAASRNHFTCEQVPLVEHGFSSVSDIVVWLQSHDTHLKDFLFKHSVNDEMLSGALEWMERDQVSVKHHACWWSRDNLGRIRGLGQEFAFGVAYSLKRYIRSIEAVGMFLAEGRDAAYAKEILEKIETILARNRAANVLLVSEPGTGDMDIIAALAEKINDGRSVASIAGKHVVLFDDDAFIATHNTKESFERSFLRLLSEANYAGNTIMVIENIPDFITNVESLNVDIDDLIERFLESDNIQFIVTSNPDKQHEEIERHPEFMKHFEVVRMEHPDLGSTVRVLEDTLLLHEYRHRIFFTYPSVRRVAESADRYIVEGVMPDKALSLLSEVTARAVQDRTSFITPDFVDAIVRDKTGIAVGPIMDHERELLLHLEEKLHERVVGQDEAIQAIARAMRRARTGIQDSGRPIGSFLFLGSTGVGKTETAKALAYVFFGSEERMVRFDMSEYSSGDALSRLLGETGTGSLPAALREHPYGVLLLDEFEKSSPEVRDLFLQILDEGAFTDARGKKVNARNTIIIATSNAGSNLIWDITKAGGKADDAKDTIIDTIIKEHIMKPELINRFDSVVIFNSLGISEQEKIARIMLAELASRIKAMGYGLNMDEAVVELLMKEGFNPEFGARPMRRAIQDIIEEKIAEKILAENLQPGTTISLTAEDFAEVGAPQ